ncbi:class B sortase [Bacillus sp. JCM 19041]|uniref:class B sortase n=1 Tax=Bacillus sp. JCM 19041 TaxID=1460637 RepID=UPI000AFC2F05
MVKRIASKLVTLLAAGLFVFAAGKLIHIGYDYWKNQRVLEEAQELYWSRESKDSGKAHAGSNEEAGENEEQRASFDQLHEVNTDIVGWLAIGGTVIDYPVLQGEDNDYYLNRNFKREQTRAGSIFMDYRNDPMSLGRHTILYGHRMKDGSMFSDLTSFTDESFFSNPPDMYIDTVTDQYDIEVFAAYYTDTRFYYIETDFESDQAFASF